MTTEEVDLDAQWRARFGQPLPMLGCSDIVREILSRTPEAEAKGGRSMEGSAASFAL